MANGVKRWWVLQQGTEYFKVESAEPPDLTVPDGQRRKVIRASYATKDEADGKGRELAKFWNGTWRE